MYTAVTCLSLVSPPLPYAMRRPSRLQEVQSRLGKPSLSTSRLGRGLPSSSNGSPRWNLNKSTYSGTVVFVVRLALHLRGPRSQRRLGVETLCSACSRSASSRSEGTSRTSEAPPKRWAKIFVAAAMALELGISSRQFWKFWPGLGGMGVEGAAPSFRAATAEKSIAACCTLLHRASILPKPDRVDSCVGTAIRPLRHSVGVASRRYGNSGALFGRSAAEPWF